MIHFTTCRHHPTPFKIYYNYTTLGSHICPKYFVDITSHWISSNSSLQKIWFFWTKLSFNFIHEMSISGTYKITMYAKWWEKVHKIWVERKWWQWSDDDDDDDDDCRTNRLKILWQNCPCTLANATRQMGRWLCIHTVECLSSHRPTFTFTYLTPPLTLDKQDANNSKIDEFYYLT